MRPVQFRNDLADPVPRNLVTPADKSQPDDPCSIRCVTHVMSFLLAAERQAEHLGFGSFNGFK